MKKKILIVEDHEELIKFMQMSFKDSYETLSVKHGEEAVGLAVKEVPDLIIMDLVEYEVDSLEAIPLIRQNPKTRSIPILAISAGFITNIKQECSKIGCDDFIAKPFTFTQLGFRIEKLLKQHRT